MNRTGRRWPPAGRVLGDVNEANALQAEGGTFKLIDPDGLRAEPACDLGTIVRCAPDTGDDLWVRTERLAARTGVDATAIWEWGTVHRVIGGLNSVRIGFQPFRQPASCRGGSPYADRLTRPVCQMRSGVMPNGDSPQAADFGSGMGAAIRRQLRFGAVRCCDRAYARSSDVRRRPRAAVL